MGNKFKIFLFHSFSIAKRVYVEVLYKYFHKKIIYIIFLFASFFTCFMKSLLDKDTVNKREKYLFSFKLVLFEDWCQNGDRIADFDSVAACPMIDGDRLAYTVFINQAKSERKSRIGNNCAGDAAKDNLMTYSSLKATMIYWLFIYD